VNHTLSWVPGYTVSSDAAMASAWNITGPLLDGCTAQVLDCSLPAPGTVYPNPAAPFTVPGISCNVSANTEPKLVFIGSKCALIKHDNAYGCAWENRLQAFVGAGCVMSGEPTQCACRHVRAAAHSARSKRMLLR
jgi:hypothetical protein